ncbi:MAG: adenylate/guanylate cyclase domain-containing protein [Deltaproteobacteria bacterium]|nr:adenylate/guanylate cyclase domain-containing protein [Deltaproteobacteria bacterium]
MRFLFGVARDCVTPQALIAGYAEALRADGVSLERAFLLTPTLHPDVACLTFTWRCDVADVQSIERSWAGVNSTEDQDSPLRRINEGTHVVIRRGHPARLPRRRRARQGRLHRLRRRGDPRRRPHVAPHRDQVEHASPSGFTLRDVELCLASKAWSAPLLDAHIARQAARKLLAVYVGANAGARVVAGVFRRGDGGSIRAAVRCTDMGDFTALSDRLPREELLELLNAYFDCVLGAVYAHGGEVLNFIGDSVLAILRADDDAGTACAKALAAARDAFVRAVAANAQRGERVPIEFGTSIHVGDVQDGNIGGPRRLDFTDISPTVNLASRIQGLCRPLGRPLLVSEEVARAVDAACEDLGPHSLKGVAEPMRIFGPR